MLSEFDAEDLIVADKRNDSSTFKRLDDSDLSDWLDEMRGQCPHFNYWVEKIAGLRGWCNQKAL